MGLGFAMVSVIWELDSWSLAKQSSIYFLIACIIMFPIAYITNWMKHSIDLQIALGQVGHTSVTLHKIEV